MVLRKADIKTSEVIDALKEGNRRFVNDKGVVVRYISESLHLLKDNQQPVAAVVGCSDSRVPIEIIFDCGVGQLFVVRTAGNGLYDSSTLGSIEYAVNVLKVKAVVVLSHSRCGAVTVALNKALPPENDNGGEFEMLIDRITQDIPQYIGKPELLDDAIRANAHKQVERLKDVPSIAEKVIKGDVIVTAAHYNIEDGRVIFEDFYDN